MTNYDEFTKNIINCKGGDLGETLLHYYTGSDNEPNDQNICDLLIQYGALTNITYRYFVMKCLCAGWLNLRG